MEPDILLGWKMFVAICGLLFSLVILSAVAILSLARGVKVLANSDVSKKARKFYEEFIEAEFPVYYHQFLKDQIDSGAFTVDMSITEILDNASKNRWLVASDRTHAWIRRDGFVIGSRDQSSHANVGAMMLGKHVEARYARIANDISSVNEAIECVSRPTDAMRVAAFQILRERSVAREKMGVMGVSQ